MPDLSSLLRSQFLFVLQFHNGAVTGLDRNLKAKALQFFDEDLEGLWNACF
jgi:hypothetical protein